MKFLNRNQSIPDILVALQKTTKSWDQVRTEEKKLIWEELINMQGTFCAYCESRIIGGRRNRIGDSHIEHFCRRQDDSQKIFEWENLFGSCEHHGKNTCGKAKDQGQIDYNKLLKPDNYKPEEYFSFNAYTGEILIKIDLSRADKDIAEYTRDKFNLNYLVLIQKRYHEIQTQHINERINEILENFSEDIEECKYFLHELFQEIEVSYKANAFPYIGMFRIIIQNEIHRLE